MLIAYFHRVRLFVTGSVENGSVDGCRNMANLV